MTYTRPTSVPVKWVPKSQSVRSSVGSVAPLQSPRGRLAGYSFWHLRFVVYSSGDNLVEMPTPEEFLCGGWFCHSSRYRRKPSLSSLHQNPPDCIWSTSHFMLTPNRARHPLRVSSGPLTKGVPSAPANSEKSRSRSWATDRSKTPAGNQ
jgi:hypothetical protein